MNQTNYKEIAKIIKYSKPEESFALRGVVIQLADYFEKEDKQERIGRALKNLKQTSEPFNKTKFLKNCGVKE